MSLALWFCLRNKLLMKVVPSPLATQQNCMRPRSGALITKCAARLGCRVQLLY
jgi:hypothetical protein